MKELYNEGRVVGLSQYEMYVRHFLQEFPNKEIMSERQWLAATLGSGQSMILVVPAGTTAGVKDFSLPSNSQLCAANTITASLFSGEVESKDGWAVNVKSYGGLMLNDSTNHPTSPGRGDNIPYVNATKYDDWLTNNQDMLTNYLKIIDGVVIQPGDWTSTGKDSPNQDLSPKWALNNASDTPRVRLRITEKIDHDVNILLTGFMYVPIISGLSKLDTGSVDTEHPENGDFLGCECFPWGSRIIFSVPSQVYSMITKNGYSRKLPSTGKEQQVNSKAVIDYRSDNPSSYYTEFESERYRNIRVAEQVTKLRKQEPDLAVIAGFRRNDISNNGMTGKNFPPVMYGGVIDEVGEEHLYPLDTAAPGNVKMFKDKTSALSYPYVLPGTFGIWKSNDGDVYITDDTTIESDLVPITTKVKVINKGTSSAPKYVTATKARDDRTDKVQERTVYGVSLQNTNNIDLDTSGSKSKSRTDKTTTASDQTSWIDATAGLNWDNLLNALGAEKQIEILGTFLRNFRGNLPNIVSGSGGVLDIKGTGTSNIAGKLQVGEDVTKGKGVEVVNSIKVDRGKTNTYNAYTDDDEFKFNKAIQSGKNYITMSNKLRLYISESAPLDTDIPEGSIGIGWGMS